MNKKERDAEEKKWRLEDDSRTIRNFMDLKKDSSRFNEAVKHIRGQAQDLDKVARAFGRKTSRKSTRGSGR